MKPKRRNYKQFNTEAIWFSEALVVAGAPLDLSQYTTIKMQVRASPQSPQVLFELNPVASNDLQGLLQSSFAGGVLEGYVPVEQFRDLVGIASYDVIGLRGSEPEVILYGEIEFAQGVTR